VSDSRHNRRQRLQLRHTPPESNVTATPGDSDPLKDVWDGLVPVTVTAKFAATLAAAIVIDDNVITLTVPFVADGGADGGGGGGGGSGAEAGTVSSSTITHVISWPSAIAPLHCESVLV